MRTAPGSILLMLKQSRWLLVALVALSASQAYGHGMSEAEKQTIIEGGNLRYIMIGATHMLSGYDHLLFVFGIIFFLTRFKDIVKYISAFTVGHSITLIIATFNEVQVNYFLIDAVIGLSVSYIAFQNLDGFKKCFNINAPNMLVMIFCLGLIHGLGLSTRLQMLPLSEDHLLMNIISFNIGIELGQISALAFMLLLIAAFRKSRGFTTFSLITNYGLVLAGGLLFLMQMHGYEHTAKAEEFAVDTKSTQAAEDLQDQQDDWTDTVTIIIPAGEGKEYKFHLNKGDVLEYSWKTDGAALFYDFHGDPKGAAANAFESFEKSTEKEASGSLTAPFEGAHGWYWGNKGSDAVEIILKTRGSYDIIGLM